MHTHAQNVCLYTSSSCSVCFQLLRMLTRPEMDEAEAKIALIFRPNFTFWSHFIKKRKKKRNFRSTFDGTSKIVARNGLQIGTLSVNTPKTTNYTLAVITRTGLTRTRTRTRTWPTMTYKDLQITFTHNWSNWMYDVKNNHNHTIQYM